LPIKLIGFIKIIELRKIKYNKERCVKNLPFLPSLPRRGCGEVLIKKT
jgi:hypothetical protein